ncbi:MAG: hypothetical protein PHD91_00090 [bacterium]|nr:hypothetical protein [bacterium]MDD3804776.1 hypothetical protein [bacterium]MDD4152105.1 hypothetical protein [bacterium]
MLEADPEKPGGFAGIRVSGINFVLRSDGFWWPYRKPGAERSLGSLKKADIAFGKWYNYRIIRSAAGAFEWSVNGEKICTLIEPDMKGDVSLSAWRIKTAYDDVKISKPMAVSQ